MKWVANWVHSLLNLGINLRTRACIKISVKLLDSEISITKYDLIKRTFFFRLSGNSAANFGYTTER